MKTFNQFTKHINESAFNSRVQLRDNDRGTSTHSVPPEYKKDVVGWFSNKYNAGGWVLTKLSPYDAKWLRSKGVSTKSVFRAYTDTDNTSIVKINAKTGAYAFLDNEHLETTDDVRFEKASKFTKLYIDNEITAKEFA